MAENLDDDVPFEALPPVITSAKAEPRRSKPARETARDAETPHGPPPAPIPDDAGAELALISAIMGDGGGGSRTCIPTLEPEAFTGAEARALWSAFRADVDPDDLITLSEKSGVTLPRLIAIADGGCGYAGNGGKCAQGTVAPRAGFHRGFRSNMAGAGGC